MKNGQARLMANKLFQRHTPSVQQRILRINDSFELGYKIRGYFRQPLSSRRLKKKLQRGGHPPEWGSFKTKGGKIHFPCEMGWISREEAIRLWGPM
jgi:hypothetical protein